MHHRRPFRAVFALALISFASGLVLLQEPLTHPVFTKFALGARALPADFSHLQMPEDEDEEGVIGNVETPDFLMPHVPWDEVIAGLSHWFPERTGSYRLPVFNNPSDLLQAVKAGSGECSNWTESLIVMCLSEGRLCREWAVIPRPSSGSIGHSVVDFWAPDLQQWVLVDVFLGFWARSNETGDPLSALEAEELLLQGPGRLQVVALDGRVVDHSEIQSYFGDPDSRLVMMANNNPIALAAHWSRRIEALNKPLGQFVQRLSRVAPLYMVTPPVVDTSVGGALFRVRFKSILGLLLITLGGVGATICFGLKFFRPASA